MADLDTRGDVEVRIRDINENEAIITEGGALSMESFGSLLIDEVFADGTIDIVNRWTETIVGGASKSFANKNLQLSVTTASGDQISEVFKESVSPLSGADAEYATALQFGVEQTDNVKEWGVSSLDGQDGLFFRLDGSTLYFVERNAGSETMTDITSFKPTDSEYHIYRIRFGTTSKYNAVIDIDDVASKGPGDIPITSTKTFVPFWNHENTGLLAGAASALETVGVIIADKSGVRVINTGRDDNGFIRDVAVNSNRRILVSQEPPTPPPATTAVTQIAFGSMSGTADTLYTITSGKTLVLQRFSAGAEVDATSGNVVYLYEDPNGDLSVLNIIEAIYISGASGQADLATSFTGDGTRRILMRRFRFGGGAKEIFGRWEGYEQ